MNETLFLVVYAIVISAVAVFLAGLSTDQLELSQVDAWLQGIGL